MRARQSLKLRLFIIIFFLTLVSTFILSNLVARVSEKRIMADQSILLREVVQNMASRLGQDMNTRAGEIRFLTRMSAIRDSAVSLEEKRQLFEDVKKAYPYYAWIGMTDKQGNIIVGTEGLLEGKNVSKRSWFVEGSKGLHFGDAHDAFLLAKLMPKPKWDDLPLRLVDVSAPVVDQQGELIGVVCGHLSLDWAFEAREALLDNLADQKVGLVVLNDAGKVLMGTPSLPSLKVDLSTLGSWERLQQNDSAPRVETWPDGVRYLTAATRESAYKAYTGMGWVLVARKQESLALAPAARLSRTILLIGAISAMLLGAVIWYLIGRQMRPLERVSQAADQITRNMKPEIPTIAGNDEIAVFSRSLFELVSSLKGQNEQLRLSNRIFEESEQGIVVTDNDTRIIRVNKAFCAITQYSENEVIGQKPSMMSSGRHDASFYKSMWESIKQHGHWSGEIWNRDKEGGLYPEWLTINALYDDEGKVSHYIGLFTDITEKKQYEEKLLHLANYDTLTNLPNRNLLQEHIQGAIEQSAASNSQLALLFIDLDKFKHINDTLGHPAGDSVLQEVANRFLAKVKRGQTLARWGGDEFVLLLPGADAIQATQAAKSILDTLTRPFQIENLYYHINASVGIANYPNDGNSVESLLRCADTAMYRAKQLGENAYQLYEREMNASVEQFLKIDGAIRQALNNHGQGFRLVFQPQFNIHGDEVTGIEALIRWNDEMLGEVGPDEFIPVAEDTRQIVQLGRWIVHNALKSFKQLLDNGSKPVTMSINCSTQQLLDDSFVTLVTNAATQNNIPSHLIRLEVTESAIMSNEDKITEVLKKLQALGFTLSIDDFGTGFSCLHYIQKLHPDEIKIDKSFIQTSTLDDDSRNIIAFTVGLAKSMQLEVVAEGVETYEQLEVLRPLGDVKIQGYLMSKPLQLEELQEMLHKMKRS